jgi:hypothetical protein
LDEVDLDRQATLIEISELDWLPTEKRTDLWQQSVLFFA